MKKILTFILLVGVVLSFAACTDKGGASSTSTEPVTTEPVTTEPVTTEPATTPSEITLQEVYDAGKNHLALLGDHESVYLVYTYNGKMTQEDYYNKVSFYTFMDGEFFEIGADNWTLSTDHSEYVYTEGIYALWVSLTTDGMVDQKEGYSIVGTVPFISTEMLDEDGTTTLTVNDGLIIVTCAFEEDEVALIGENIVSCVETYTLDAETREMIEVKTVYTYEDGTVDEGIVTITRDVEVPEGMKPFLAYDQETENVRTITIVSNPGAENEKTETIQAPKGLFVGFAPDWDIEATFGVYLDAECTQLAEDQDPDADLTVYIKWDA